MYLQEKSFLVSYFLCILFVSCSLSKSLPEVTVKSHGEDSKPPAVAAILFNETEALPSRSNSTDSGVETDERIGLTLNRAQSQAFNPYTGGFGHSQSQTYGFQAGILDRRNQYHPIANQFGGHSNSYNSGPGAPQVWTGSRSQGRPGFIGGSGYGGYRGGIGNTRVNSQAINQAIPLGDGTVLLSNLRDPSSKTSAEEPEEEKKSEEAQEEVVEKRQEAQEDVVEKSEQ